MICNAQFMSMYDDVRMHIGQIQVNINPFLKPTETVSTSLAKPLETFQLL